MCAPTTAVFEPAIDSSTPRSTRRGWLWACALLSACSPCGTAESSLEPLFDLPSFQLERHDGQGMLSREDLLGRITVADFIFTRCPSFCPMLTARMQDLQETIGDSVPEALFLSVSVDPDHDTPKVLREYIRTHEVDTRNWFFLTGPAGEVKQAIEGGFRVRAGERVPDPEGGDNFDITHSRTFVLVGPAASVLGYYRVDTDGLEQLAKDMRRLGKSLER